MTAELNPCPFCGKAPEVILEPAKTSVVEGSIVSQGDHWYVCCHANKGGCGGSGGYSSTEAQAIESWNRRSASLRAAEGVPSNRKREVIVREAIAHRDAALAAVSQPSEQQPQEAPASTAVDATGGPTDVNGVPKVALTPMEDLAVQACNLVKAWAESDRATPFPEEAHMLADGVLMFAAQRRKGVQ